MPSRDVLLDRLIAVLDHPRAIERCYPALLRGAERPASGREVAVMVGAAIHDCGLGDRSGLLPRLLSARAEALLAAVIGRDNQAALGDAREAWRALGNRQALL